MNLIWKNAKVIMSDHEKGKGGTAILIHPKRIENVGHRGSSHSSKLVWVSMVIG